MKVWRAPTVKNKSVQRWWLGVTMPLLLAVALFLAACEYPGIAHPLAAQAESQASLAPALDAAGLQAPDEGAADAKVAEGSAATNRAGETTPAGVAARGIEVALKDFRLDPDQVAGKAGSITFVLKNEGRYTHDFRVEGQGVDDKAPKVGAGRTFEWQVALEPGTYRISCPISNHADRGMTGTLSVAP